MVPLAHDGDFILSRPITWFDTIRVGDVVVFKHPDLGYMVKVVSLIESKTARVEGLSPLSVDSKFCGWIQIRDIKTRPFAIVPQSFKFSRRRGSLQMIRRSKVCGLMKVAKTLSKFERDPTSCGSP